MGRISSGFDVGADGPPPDVNPFGGQMLPLLGVAEFGSIGGVLLIVVGIVLHVVATARRNRIDERLPLHAPVPRPRSW